VLYPSKAGYPAILYTLLDQVFPVARDRAPAAHVVITTVGGQVSASKETKAKIVREAIRVYLAHSHSLTLVA